MSAQDGSGRTGRIVDFDGLDAEADAGADRPMVVDFDDLGATTDADDPRNRVVSFDDLDAGAESDPARSRVLSFDDEPGGPGSPAPGTGRVAADGPTVDDLVGGDPGGGETPGDIVSFDGLDPAAERRAAIATGPRSTARRARRPTTDRAREGGRAPVDTTRRATTGGTRTPPGALADAGPVSPDPTDDAGAGRDDGGRRGGRGRDGGRDARGRDGTRAGRGGTAAGPTSPQDDESRAREICLRLLTDRARTVKELSDALRRKEIPDDVANRVLERFDEVGLVDDEAFAGQWVRSRHRHKGLGRRAIALELHRKGVDREIADEALSEIDPESEQARARELVDRRIRTMTVATKEDRASTSRRLVGMLARKGYGSGVAYGVVRDAIAAKGAEEDELGEAPADD